MLATALIPFLAVYLPKASETGMHAWAEALVFAPAPNDAVNVGTGNFMFGRLFNLICPRWTAANDEELMGIPPTLMYLFICGWFRLLFADQSTTVLPRAMAITTAVTWLLLFRFGSHSGWKLVYDFIPGAKGVRVVSRYQIFLLTLPVVLITILHVQGLAARMPRAVTMLVCALPDVGADWHQPVGERSRG